MQEQSDSGILRFRPPEESKAKVVDFTKNLLIEKIAALLLQKADRETCQILYHELDKVL